MNKTMAGEMDPMCGFNKVVCPVNMCHMTEGVYNGICCQFHPSDQLCICKSGFEGRWCERRLDDEINSMLASFHGMTSQNPFNVMLFGIFLGLLALLLTFILMFVIVKMMRRKNVEFVDEVIIPGEQIIDESGQVMNTFRRRPTFITQASYCCSDEHILAGQCPKSQLIMGAVVGGSANSVTVHGVNPSSSVPVVRTKEDNQNQSDPNENVLLVPSLKVLAAPSPNGGVRFNNNNDAVEFQKD